MTRHIPIAPPSQVRAADVDFYILTMTGGGCFELGDEMHNRKAIVRSIIHGQYEGLAKVWCGNPAMNSFQDVSEDIAREVYDLRSEGYNIKGELFDWVQENGGCSNYAMPAEW